jgi:hypothetical protein
VRVGRARSGASKKWRAPRGKGELCRAKMRTLRYQVRQKMEKATTEATTPTLRPRIAAMSTQSGMWVPDTNRPIFDPHLDIATVVFSHVRCVKTRVNLALVSKVWRDASKTAAAYPRTFDLDAFADMDSWTRIDLIIDMIDNDKALSLPYERVVGLLGETAKYVCNVAASWGSLRLLEWARVNNLDWGTHTCLHATGYGHLLALKYLHENGCPWHDITCYCAADQKHWDCLQYAVDNKAPEWEKYAKKHAEHLR